jgi:hypothetical protein
MTHIVDQVSLGAIVQVRGRLLEQQAKGRKVLRLESQVSEAAGLLPSVLQVAKSD